MKRSEESAGLMGLLCFILYRFVKVVDQRLDFTLVQTTKHLL
jgi:hypothetical protein